jgi:hypothetical protein
MRFAAGVRMQPHPETRGTRRPLTVSKTVTWGSKQLPLRSTCVSVQGAMKGFEVFLKILGGSHSVPWSTKSVGQFWEHFAPLPLKF